MPGPGDGSTWFGPVAMQPGKPQGFGQVGRTLLFALPGNPVSAFVPFEAFVRPALRRLRGLTNVRREAVRAVAAEGWASPAGRRQFVPVTVDVDHHSGRTVRPVLTAAGSGAHRIAALSRADGLVVVDEQVTAVRPGQPVEVATLR